MGAETEPTTVAIGKLLVADSSHKLSGTQGMSTQTSSLSAERTYGVPCMVLVINDNPYGLMVALSYMCRTADGDVDV
jgi:hypothetical protein